MRFILIASLLIIFVSGCIFDTGPKACFDMGYCVNVEVVSDGENFTKGLMYRESLAKDSGMLFSQGEPWATRFWMKNMSFPLDIIWIDANQTIMHIEENVPPCLKDPCPTYGPDKESLFVLEVNTGTTRKHEIHVGSKMTFK